MNHSARLGRLSITLLVALPLLVGAKGAPVVFEGPELQVNETVLHNQNRPAVAELRKGYHAVVWDDDRNVFARLYRRAEPATSEFRVNATEPGSFRHYPDACAMKKGFVVAWGVNIWSSGPRTIMARVFDDEGQPLGRDVQVSEAGFQQGPPAVSCSDRGFVVAWQVHGMDGDSQGVVARRFDAEGEPLADEFVVNTFVEGTQGAPAVAARRDGSFLIAWQSFWQVEEWDVFAQNFGPGGERLGPEIRLNGDAAGSQSEPALALSETGRLAVIWLGSDDHGFGVFGRVLSPSGSSLGPEFAINSFTEGHQRSASAVFLDADVLSVVWHSEVSHGGDPSSWGVFGRLFDPAGVALSGEYLVNTNTDSRQSRPDLAAGARGRFFVAWQSYQQDGSLEGAFAQNLRLRGVR